MTIEQLPDIRRHPDGRWVVCWEPDRQHWRVFEGGTFIGSLVGNPVDIWRPVLVADLPEPDHHCDNSHGYPTPQWEIISLRDVDGIITPWAQGVEVDGELHDAEDAVLAQLEIDALKLLAAIHQHRQYQTKAVSR